MLRYNDLVANLFESGLKYEFVSEITGLTMKHLKDNYEESTQRENLYSIKAVTFKAAIKLLEDIPIDKVFLNFKYYDVNLLYQGLVLRYGIDLSVDTEDMLNQDILKLIKHGLSFRNCSLLFIESNFGFIPDHSSLRRKLIKAGLYKEGISLIEEKKGFNKNKILLCYKIIKLNGYKLNLYDFIQLYFKYFYDIKPNAVFKALCDSEGKTIRKCIVCGEHVAMNEGERYCSACRTKAAKNDSDCYSII